MVSEDKLVAFLSLEQLALDIEESTKLLDQFLPTVFQKLNSVGYPYIFLSAIFIDTAQKIKQVFFTDGSNQSLPAQVTKEENFFQKGSEWEMKVLYGEAAVVSDISNLINSSYPQYNKIHSLLVLPIQHSRELTGVLVLASAETADKIDAEEIEFGKMITRLVDLSYRLQDTESSLTQITQQVYQMNAKLHQLDKLKDDFVSVASHELRTPMTAIRSYAWMALHRSDIPLSQKLQRYLYRVLVSTERLINLVNDMLNLSRIEAGRIEISPKTFDMLELVRDIIEEVKMKANEKRIQITVFEHAMPKVFADPDKVREILLNLIGNSLKFTYPGGLINIDFFSDGKTLEVTVKDNGAGISKDDLSKLFHKFSRLDNSYTSVTVSGGTGLGLYISKNLVELMHGKIWVTSDGEDKGASFSFSLPVASEEVLQHASEYKVLPEDGMEAKALEPVAV